MNPARNGLRIIPGVGVKIAALLTELGYSEVSDLRDAQGEEIYERLNARRGVTADRCLLYVFRCAVYFAANEVHDPELLKWWRWKDEVK